jgi:bacitracin transport system permease protein
MIFIEALYGHFQHPEEVFTFTDIYDHSLLYIMIITNMMIYVTITAYLFSREYSESTLKTVLPIPVSRVKFVTGKFCALLLWIIMLTIVTWTGILALSGLCHALIGLDGFSFNIAVEWLLKFLLGNLLVYLTISPFALIAVKTKGFVAPVISSTVIVMGSAALCNQDLGALYPWTATFFLVKGKLASTGYPPLLAISIVIAVSVIGFFMTFHHFQKEDFK